MEGLGRLAGWTERLSALLVLPGLRALLVGLYAGLVALNLSLRSIDGLRQLLFRNLGGLIDHTLADVFRDFQLFRGKLLGLVLHLIGRFAHQAILGLGFRQGRSKRRAKC